MATQQAEVSTTADSKSSDPTRTDVAMETEDHPSHAGEAAEGIMAEETAPSSSEAAEPEKETHVDDVVSDSSGNVERDEGVKEGADEGSQDVAEECKNATSVPNAVNLTPKSIAVKPKTLTPKQRELQEARQKKQEERDRAKKAKEEEKDRIRLEKQK